MPVSEGLFSCERDQVGLALHCTCRGGPTTVSWATGFPSAPCSQWVHWSMSDGHGLRSMVHFSPSIVTCRADRALFGLRLLHAALSKSGPRPAAQHARSISPCDTVRGIFRYHQQVHEIVGKRQTGFAAAFYRHRTIGAVLLNVPPRRFHVGRLDIDAANDIPLAGTQRERLIRRHHSPDERSNLL